MSTMTEEKPFPEIPHSGSPEKQKHLHKRRTDWANTAPTMTLFVFHTKLCLTHTQGRGEQIHFSQASVPKTAGGGKELTRNGCFLRAEEEIGPNLNHWKWTRFEKENPKCCSEEGVYPLFQRNIARKCKK